MNLNRNRGLIFTVALLAAAIVGACSALPTPDTETEAEAAAEIATPQPDAESVTTVSDGEFLPAEDPPFSTTSWSTDFTRRLVPYTEILSGGPPKDGIPAVNDPTFAAAATGAEWMGDADPVIAFEHNGEVRGYPLAILIWHEIVNDEVGGKPVAVTFCPLCNASIVFDREHSGQILDFGTTGKLRNSDLIMYDRQTETWWQQFSGEGIIGEFAGDSLSFLPSQVISYADFLAAFPDGMIMERPPASRDYGRNPYAGYDSTSGRPFLFTGELDDRLPSTERVVGVEINEDVMAYAFGDVAEIGVVNDTVGDVPIVVFHKFGTASALDGSRISESRDVGSVGVFSRNVDGQELTFDMAGDGLFTDRETGSSWNILGVATAGELAGTELDAIISFDHFWFAWSAFHPDTGLFGDGA